MYAKLQMESKYAFRFIRLLWIVRNFVYNPLEGILYLSNIIDSKCITLASFKEATFGNRQSQSTNEAISLNSRFENKKKLNGIV